MVGPRPDDRRPVTAHDRAGSAPPARLPLRVLPAEPHAPVPLRFAEWHWALRDACQQERNGGMTRIQAHVARAVAAFAATDGTSIRAGRQAMAAAADMSEDRVGKAVRGIVRAGWLIRVAEGHRGQVAEYRLAAPAWAAKGGADRPPINGKGGAERPERGALSVEKGGRYVGDRRRQEEDKKTAPGKGGAHAPVDNSRVSEVRATFAAEVAAKAAPEVQAAAMEQIRADLAGRRPEPAR